MQINPGAAEFPHRQIAAQLKAQVRRGDWGPGERLPSIPAIAEMFGVAKQTVQRAVDQLRVEGILITKPGSGTYVRGTRRRLNRLSRGRYGGFRGYHTDLAARYRQQLVSVGRSPAPPEVADAFGVADGTELLCRRHLVRTDDSPVEVGASWFLPGRHRRHLAGAGRGVRPPALPGGRGGHRPAVRHRHRHDQRPPAQPGGGRDPPDPAGHPGAAPAARRLRRRAASRSRWPRPPGPAR